MIDPRLGGWDTFKPIKTIKPVPMIPKSCGFPEVCDTCGEKIRVFFYNWIEKGVYKIGRSTLSMNLQRPLLSVIEINNIMFTLHQSGLGKFYYSERINSNRKEDVGQNCINKVID